jgi:hypothetical protein
MKHSTILVLAAAALALTGLRAIPGGQGQVAGL